MAAGAILPDESILNNKYVVKKLIGAGGFGRTYLMMDKLLNIPVAVKELTNPVEKDKAQFLKEAQMMARFSQDQGIVNVRDFFESNGTAYIVMEYLEGMDLQEYVKARGRMPVGETLEKLRPVMESLAVIHREGFIHRDVSPDNIRMAADGRLKLLDFGAARDINEEGQTMTVLLKKGYTPAEQYRGKAYQGPWTDVYALSGVIYYCLTGKTPQDSIQRLFHDELGRPSALGARIEPRQEEALLKGLAIQPEDRYASMEELEEAFFPGEQKRNSILEDDRLGDGGLGHGGPKKAGLTREEGDPAKGEAEPEKAKIAEQETKKHPGEDIWNQIEQQKIKEQKEGRGQPEEKRLDSGLAGRESEGHGGEQKQPEHKPESSNSESGKPGSSNLQSSNSKSSKPESSNSESSNSESNHPEKERKRTAAPGKNEYQEEAKRQAQKAKKKKKRILMILLPVGAASLIACFGLFLILAVMFNPFRERSLVSLSTIEDRVLGSKEIKQIQRDKKCTDLNLWNCEISDEVLSQMTALDRLEAIDFNQCYGFTSLDPLAQMAGLERLTINGDGIQDFIQDKCFDGDDWFSVDFPNVKQLHIYGFNRMENTEFLKHFPSLEYMFLSMEGFDSLDFLNCMDNLKQIEIHDDLSGVDVSPIGNCQNLQDLYLSDTGICDLSMLRGMQKLTNIEAMNCQISDISALEDCPNLYTLVLDGNQISDLSALEGKEGLRTLCLNQNQVTDLSPLEGSGLFRLELAGNQIEDISFLGNCKELNQLYLQDNQISSLEPIAGCQKLISLNVSGNRLVDLKGCEGLIALTGFYAGNNQLTDISGIANSTSIKHMDVSGNRLTDIRALDTGFAALRGLNISDNQVEDIGPLAKSSELRYLIANHNRLSSLAPLKGISQLNAVFVDGNRLTGLEGLENKENLFALTAYENQIENIQPIAGSANLLYLDLGRNQIKDIAPLKNLSFAYKGMVLLEHNQIRDISPLPVASGYYLLSLYDNPIGDLSVLNGMTEYNFQSDKMYLPYVAGTDHQAMSELRHGDTLCMVDVPLDKQAEILKQASELVINRSWGSIRFADGGKADEEMEEHRTTLNEKSSEEIQRLEGDAAIAGLFE